MVVGGIREKEEDEDENGKMKSSKITGRCIGSQQLARRHRRHGQVWHHRRWICPLLILHSLRRR